MKEEIIKLYKEFVISVDEYAEDRRRYTDKDEIVNSLSQFMFWLERGYIDGFK